MQFNGHADEQDLISDITFWTGVDTTKYTLKSRTRAVNAYLGKAWALIFDAYGGWKFMGDDQSDVSTGVPYADQTITSGTDKYVIPTGALAIEGIQFKPSSGSSFQILNPMTEQEFLARGGDGSFPASGVPEFYMLQGDIIRLLPNPNYTLATALRVHFSKEMTNFASTDTTSVPGFASVFHRYLSIGASFDYATAKDLPDKIKVLGPLVSDYEARMRHFYATRWRDRFPHSMRPGNDLVSEFT